MRYLKYTNKNKTKRALKKAQYSVLDKDEKRMLILSRVLSFAAFVIFAAVTLAMLELAEWLFRGQDTLLMSVLYFAAKAAALLIGFLAGVLFGFPLIIAAAECTERLQKIYTERRHEISSLASDHLHKYYGLQEPYIVTKCYDSTNKGFKNKDVCIFECDGEIRLKKELCHTVNLTERDFGCYSFSSDEITLCYRDYIGTKATVLNVGNETFLLGKRAKRAIEKLSAYGTESIFIPASQKKKGSSAYYELQICKKELPADELVKSEYTFFESDSLLVHISDECKLFKHYLRYLSQMHTPDSGNKFYYAGVNYYTKEETRKILERIEKDRPPYCEPLIAWLRTAQAYNGFFFLGI
jgi:hypothetical protein